MRPVASELELIVVEDLTLPIDEARDTLRALRTGDVDAVLVSEGGAPPKVFILKGADHAHRVLFERLNEGALTMSADTTILSANPRLAELLGRPLERVLGTPLRRYIAPADAEAFAALLAQAGTGGKGEVSLRNDRGDRISVMLSMSAVGDSDADPLAVVATDLRPLKKAQLALVRANDELEARVEGEDPGARPGERGALRRDRRARAPRERSSGRRQDALALADRRKDEFLSMLAHELRNPLAPILTAAAMLRSVAKEEPKVERYRSIIERQVMNLARLLDDLLDVSRITRGTVALRKRQVDLSDVARSAVEASRPLIDARGHLFVALPARPVPILVDPTRLEQVLVNLLNNAAKYTDRGGRIHLSVETVGEDVTLRVEDDGLGIPADLLPRIFDLFVQGERSLDRSQGGLGIGLTLVKKLVEMHGGRVEARSGGPGKGSAFTVRLTGAGAKLGASGDRAAAAPAARGDDGGAPRAAPEGAGGGGQHRRRGDADRDARAVGTRHLLRARRRRGAPARVDAAPRRGPDRRGPARDGRLRAGAAAAKHGAG